MGTSDRRRREKDERRNKILDAAQKVFLARDYHLATMDDVAAEAELGKGTLYLYFKNKDDLYIGLSQRMGYMFVDRFDEQIPLATDGLDMLERLARVFCDIVMENRDLCHVSLHCMASSPTLDTTTQNFALWRESNELAFRMVVNAVERGMRDGSIRAGLDSTLVARLFLGGITGMLIMEHQDASLDPTGGPMTADLVRSYVDFFLDSIRGAGLPAPDGQTTPDRRGGAQT